MKKYGIFKTNPEIKAKKSMLSLLDFQRKSQDKKSEKLLW